MRQPNSARAEIRLTYQHHTSQAILKVFTLVDSNFHPRLAYNLKTYLILDAFGMIGLRQTATEVQVDRITHTIGDQLLLSIDQRTLFLINYRNIGLVLLVRRVAAEPLRKRRPTTGRTVRPFYDRVLSKRHHAVDWKQLKL